MNLLCKLKRTINSSDAEITVSNEDIEIEFEKNDFQNITKESD